MKITFYAPRALYSVKEITLIVRLQAICYEAAERLGFNLDDLKFEDSTAKLLVDKERANIKNCGFESMFCL